MPHPKRENILYGIFPKRHSFVNMGAICRSESRNSIFYAYVESLLTTNSVFNSKNELSNIPLQLENLWLQSLENLVNSTTTLLQPLTAF